MINLYTLEEAAHLLKIEKPSLLVMLREKHILNVENIPYRKYRTQELFAIRMTSDTQAARLLPEVFVTKNGINWVADTLQLDDYDPESAEKQKKRDVDNEYYRRKKAEKEAWKLVICMPWTKTNNEERT